MSPGWLVHLGLVTGCGPAIEDADVLPGDTEHVFSFAVLADPHLTTDADRTERLEAAVAWLEDHAEPRRIELVFIVGDIGWDGGLPVAKEALDQLPVPYVPILGDNEVQYGAEQTFDTVFQPVFADLESRFDTFNRAPVEVYNPEHDTLSWFQNLSFEHRDVHFVGLDWNAREIGTIFGEMADLHDFDGGSWPWFAARLGILAGQGPTENVVLLSHHPMHMGVGAFDVDEMDTVAALTSSLAEHVAGNYAGHYHFDMDVTLEDAGYDLHVTDATWDDDNRIRVTEVWSDGTAFEYRQELITP